MTITLAQWEEVQVFLAGLGDPLGFRNGIGLREGLSHYLSLLLAKNQDVNLTAIRDADTAVWKHLADSLALAQWEELGTVLDWGSGGGLPGIPLALARRSVGVEDPVYFLDSVGKKVRAIEEFCGALGLHRSRFFHGRGEVLLAQGDLEAVDTIVMRAVAPAERAVHWLVPKVRRFVLFLGPQQKDLWFKEQSRVGRKGFVFGRQSQFQLPHNQGERILLELVRK